MGESALTRQIKIYEQRTGEKVSVKELAAACNVTEDYIRKLIRGDRTGSSRVLFILARRLGCHVDDFFIL